VEGSEVVGMITETDLLQAFIEMFGADKEGLAAGR
jgi:hypothetical protein